jgi:predicted kinase
MITQTAIRDILSNKTITMLNRHEYVASMDKKEAIFYLWLHDIIHTIPVNYDYGFFTRTVRAWAKIFNINEDEFSSMLLDELTSVNWPNAYNVMFNVASAPVIMNDTIIKNNGSNGSLNILIGAPGSGKSTYVKTAHPDTIISRDAFIVGDYSHLFTEDMTANQLYHKCYEASLGDKTCDQRFMANARTKIETHKHVWVDMTNMSIASRRKWINQANINKKSVVCYITTTTLNTCLSRQHTRGDKSIPDLVIEDMFKRLQIPWLDVECSDLIIL